MKVLVIEDTADLAYFDGLLLDHLGHESVEWEGSFPELITADLSGYDAFVVDIILPGVSGLDIARRLRDEYPGKRVVLVSAERIAPPILAELKLGPFLLKPFTKDDLRDALDG